MTSLNPTTSLHDIERFLRVEHAGRQERHCELLRSIIQHGCHTTIKIA